MAITLSAQAAWNRWSTDKKKKSEKDERLVEGERKRKERARERGRERGDKV